MLSFVAMGCQVLCQTTSAPCLNIKGEKIFLYIFCLIGDAHHITQPHNDGRGAVLAMTSAIKQVRSCASFIDLFFFQVSFG